MIYYQNKKSYNQLFSENYKDFIKDSLYYKYKLLNDLKTFEYKKKHTPRIKYIEGLNYGIMYQLNI